MKLEELQVYQLAMDLGESIWEIVIVWNYFEKDTIGKQLVRAADSVAANLSEGFGRFFYKENKQFCYYSRGSLFETKTWLTKAKNRKLITEDQFESFTKDIDLIGKKLNSYIKSIGNQSNQDLLQNDHQ
jgi:four helix bundle protein